MPILEKVQQKMAKKEGRKECYTFCHSKGFRQTNNDFYRWNLIYCVGREKEIQQMPITILHQETLTIQGRLV